MFRVSTFWRFGVRRRIGRQSFARMGWDPSNEMLNQMLPANIVSTTFKF